MFDQHPLAYSHLPPTLTIPEDASDDKEQDYDDDDDRDDDDDDGEEGEDDDDEDEYADSPGSTTQPPVSGSPPLSRESSQTSIDAGWFLGNSIDSKDTSFSGIRDSVMTEATMATALASDGSCKFEDNDWFAQFSNDLDISDDPPTRATLQLAGGIPVVDAAGNSRAFRTLFTPGDVVGERQLLVFIRHFFCGACQAYVRALTAAINAEVYFTMPVPTSIVVIGCGSADLIRHYKASTQCPFPIFADTSRQIFKLLGMGVTYTNFGRHRPQYMGDISLYKQSIGQVKEVSRTKGRKKLQGGNPFQIGGEFLFENGEVVWCHRMKNWRGHAEMDIIKRVLEIDR